MKKIYYYIDEAGTVEGNSHFFILGCFKTDTPILIENKINDLFESILNDPYFAFERDKLIRQGFHASENHPDIKAKLYSLISTLNIRAYLLLLDKSSFFFKSLKEKGLSNWDIYNKCIEKLFYDRLLKTRHFQNFLIFERYGNKVNNWEENLKDTIETVCEDIYNNERKKIRAKVIVKDKSEKLLSIIDYLNYLFVQFYDKKEIKNRMVENFKIIEPKIALIYKMDRDEFYHKNNRINIYKY
ncbi:MAG: hypothetical protein K9I29_07445 [Bacteroidales bacterium]|nr:hypothetical protein [Bacteroidales bacterium]MCF8328116.1 hypothetical protein [Bacteroidales bacterium]